jgi:hypothetical protein
VIRGVLRSNVNLKKGFKMVLQQIKESAPESYRITLLPTIPCAGAHPRDGMDADGRGPTMERACIACGGSGLAEHVDRTLPPPPCRLCHPEEAALHMALARETRTIAAAGRRDAYQLLRAAVVLGDSLPPAAAFSV